MDQRQGAGARRRLAGFGAVAVLAATATIAGLAQSGATASVSSGGWTTSAAVSPTSPRRATSVTITATATSSSTRAGLVDVEVYASSGAKVYQRFWDNQSFTAGQARTFSTAWSPPASEPLGSHTVKIGMFRPGWGGLDHWNDSAATFTVAAASGTTTTTAAHPTTTTTVAPTTTTVAPTTTTVAPQHFGTLPPGSALPSDTTCAALVRPAAEVRPQNATYNQTRGHGAPSNPPAPLYARVTGNFTGTTDQIIQWAACKWGIDEDIVRAQTAKESWWYQSSVGDNGESFGLMQVRQPYWGWAFNNGVGDATSSSAYNMDAALAARRNCFEGNETWLGGSYTKGDIWGCVGLWFSGRWYDSGANTYIAAVKDYLNQRIWETPGFKAG